MCWFIELTLTPQPGEDISPHQVKKWLRGQGLRLAIEPPVYTLLDSGGSCSCDLVLASGRALSQDICDSLAPLLAQEEMASLRLIWYWNRLPKRRAEVHIDLAQFNQKNEAQTLSENTYYCLNPPLLQTNPSQN